MKYLIFYKTLYNDTMENKDIIRPVFEKGEKYEIKYEDDDVYIISMKNNFYQDFSLGIEKKLENILYEVQDN